MFTGTKRAELIIIIYADNEVFSIQYKMNLGTKGSLLTEGGETRVSLLEISVI